MKDTGASVETPSSFFEIKLNPSGRFFCFFIALAFVLAAGCKKPAVERAGAQQIHGITRELEAAAKSASPAGTEIRAAFLASDKSPQNIDHLDITLVDPGSAAETQARIANIQRALNGVATRYGLTETPAESREGVQFFYRARGVPTHETHIHVKSSTSPTAGNFSGTTSATSSGAKLAIILDDLGSDRAAADEIFALPFPLTISVLPNQEHSVEIAKEGQHRGYEVMLHLPMQSVGKEHPEPQELQLGMSSSQVSALTESFLQAVPDVVGVNNHQGSQATADATLMSELMEVLREHNLFYVDSRTTAETVAFDTAQHDGVRCGFRNVPFLDDVAEVGAVRKQLALALRGAKEKGQAIAIGHPHPATLQALREMLPQAKAQGVQLVFVSAVVH